MDEIEQKRLSEIYPILIQELLEIRRVNLRLFWCWRNNIRGCGIFSQFKRGTRNIATNTIDNRNFSYHGCLWLCIESN